MTASDVMAKISELLDEARDLLMGEPLRAISYGAAIVVYVVVRIAITVGYKGFGDQPVGLLDALNVVSLAVGALLAFLTEISRQFVSSPKTVAALQAAAAPAPVPDVVDTTVQNAPPADSALPLA